ncbi:MAG: adenylyl cyclase, partial [Verrucomicrobia bacterium]|nr:adenylyl cyclase [Verrucomicrobiota bacterium]
MHLPSRFALCCVFSFGALGLVRATPPDFGPNVKIFDPSMSISQIQATVDAIANQQVPNQFGTQRYALLFMPGTYGSTSTPLNFQVGYYTSVAGLGSSPDDVVINGSIDVYNQCDSSNSCVALVNFWRSLSNLNITVTNPTFGCKTGEFWAVSQAAPMRRVHIIGLTTLMDYCTSPSFASGGFISDSEFDDNTVINGSQQQWLVRNSKLDGWTNGVWNQVFSGVVGAPDQCFPAQKNVCGPYTTLATSPVTREAPYLYVDASEQYWVFVPAVQSNSAGTTWGSGSTPGSSISIDNFFIAKPTDSVQKINSALAQGQNLILTPGVYNLDRAIEVKRPDTVVLGLGFPTLVPSNGGVAMEVADVPGVKLSGLLFDAGPVNSPVLLQVGKPHAHKSNPQDPTLLSDVFFRIGGATAGKATISLVVNSDNVILDDIWAWRADHGNGVGWTDNT